MLLTSALPPLRRLQPALASAVKITPKHGAGAVRLCQSASSGSSDIDGPDASRGFDIAEYDGLWRALARDSAWPSDRSIAIVGPTGDAFRAAVEASCEAAAGCEVLRLKAQAKARWQSVRVLLRCTSPDDFCAVHSVLKSLDGTKAII